MNRTAFSKEQLGKTVRSGLAGALALFPFALAFGATSSIGPGVSLLTAVAAGLMSSMVFQNPLGSFIPSTAVFLVFSAACAKLGLGAALTASLCAGILVFLFTFLKFSKLAGKIPMPLVLGFLSGAMVVMAILQVNLYFGIRASGATAMQMLNSFAHLGFHCNWRTMLYGTVMLVILITYPRTFPKFSRFLPAPFVGIVVTLLLNFWLIPEAAATPIMELGSLTGRLMPDAGMLLDLPGTHQVPLFLLFVAAMTVVLSVGPLLAPNHRERAGSDQGLSNIFLACIGGMPVTIPKEGPAAPKYAGFVQSSLILFFLLAFGKQLLRLPVSVLAVILIFESFRQVNWAAVKALFQQKSKAPAAMYFASAALTVLLPLEAALTVFAAVGLTSVAVTVLRGKKSLLPLRKTSDSMEIP